MTSPCTSLPGFDLLFFWMKVEKMPCPNCARPTSPKELEDFHGVCRFCRQAFQASNHHWLGGRKPQTQQESHSRSDAVWDEGQLTTAVDFDFDEVDQALGFVKHSPVAVREMAAELFQKIMFFVWGGKGVQLERSMLKFTAISSAIRPELVGNKTYEEIGQYFGVTKAAVCKIAKKFERAFNFKASRGRSEEHCATFAAAQKGHPGHHKSTRRGRPAPLRVGTTPAEIRPKASSRTAAIPSACGFKRQRQGQKS
jgi:hypothetical protein